MWPLPRHQVRVRARAPYGLASCCVLPGAVCVDGPDGSISPECPSSSQSDLQCSTFLQCYETFGTFVRYYPTFMRNYAFRVYLPTNLCDPQFGK